MAAHHFSAPFSHCTRSKVLVPHKQIGRCPLRIHRCLHSLITTALLEIPIGSGGMIGDHQAETVPIWGEEVERYGDTSGDKSAVLGLFHRQGESVREIGSPVRIVHGSVNFT